MKISFMGLGAMGRGMALNLSRCGEELLVNDLNPACLKPFEEKGIRTTLLYTDTVDSDIIFLCLPGTAAVEEILLGEKGVGPHLRKGQIVVDCSTISYLSAVKIAESLGKKGVEFIDAPVSGMVSRAAEGTLTIMVGGKKEVFGRVKPYFEYMGTDIQYMGKSGCGQLTKMINNCIYDINIAAFCELLPLAVKLGLDPEQIGGVVNTATGKSHASGYFIPHILEGEFSSGYSLKAAYKDLVHARQVCTEMNIPLPTLNGATETYQLAMAKGYGELDKGGMIRPYEELTGVRFRKKQPGPESTEK